MAITIDDFSKIWASTSPLTPYEFSESQYKEGWNFIGGTPPSRQMWDFIQKQNDEKLEYLLNNFDDYAKKTDLDDYLPLRGGTMSDGVVIGFSSTIRKNADDGSLSLYGGSVYNKGANILLNGQSKSNSPGEFYIYARTESDSKTLNGRPDGTLTWDGQPLLPVGVVQAFAGSTIPSGWLLCDGSAVSRTTYANLYACIGTTYGAGDGSSTFNLPNLTDKFIEGSATAGTEKQAGLPNITGGFSKGGTAGILDNASGSFSGNSSQLYPINTISTQYNGMINAISFDASRSNAIYGASNTVQPHALTMKYIIKY